MKRTVSIVITWPIRSRSNLDCGCTLNVQSAVMGSDGPGKDFIIDSLFIPGLTVFT